MLNEQAKAADNEQPKLTSTDISEKIDALKREVNYLVSKIKYFRPKTTKKPPTSSKTNGTNTSANKTESDSDSKGKPDGDTQGESGSNGEEKTGQQDFFDQKDEENTEKNANKPPTEEETYYEEDTTTGKIGLNLLFLFHINLLKTKLIFRSSTNQESRIIEHKYMLSNFLGKDHLILSSIFFKRSIFIFNYFKFDNLNRVFC
jgi:hypothetical protein